MTEQKNGNIVKPGIYLLPNLFTTAALFSGFYAVVAAMKGHFDSAALAVFVAMVMDTLDGRVARLTKTVSEFGAQYDSLSDVVAFGIAPSLIMYSWSLSVLGKMGWLVAFTYTAATALRLARFNTQLSVDISRYFIGLPCPAAAGIISGLVWVGYEYAILGHDIAVITAILMLMVASAQVSNIHYHSFKQLDLKGKVPFIAILCVVLVFVSVSIDPPTVLFSVFLGYGLSGPILTWVSKKAVDKDPKLR